MSCIDATFEQEFFPYLRTLTDIDGDTGEMYNVCHYLYWANLSGLDLRFELTSDDLRNIDAAYNIHIWRKYQASEEQTSLPTYELFR